MTPDEYAARLWAVYADAFAPWGFWHWVGAEGWRTELYGDHDSVATRAQALGVMLAKVETGGR